jgi:ferredoxin-NADP reductase/predicted pyridoxine 5'-phosphate oxidase superfamily flavin-nucleotide-binding protein
MMENEQNNSSSPFHSGEQKLQSRAGKRDAMEKFGRRAIRNYLPQQHREFYAQLPFIVAGCVDEEGDTWASLLAGKPGFIQSSEATLLSVQHSPIKGDPINKALASDGAPIGLLGIELSSRRRNRVNARVQKPVSGQPIQLAVDQAFGNCPQYIQTRELHYYREPSIQEIGEEPVQLTELEDDANRLIDNADTFFVSSFISAKNNPQVEGVDVSHRGGMPGFVKRQNTTLTIPDYVGNFHFNTLGNFLLNPKAGLVFTDFQSGDVLMLTGSVEILWEDDPEVKAFKGAERAWRFTMKKALWLKKALPFTASLDQYSPNSVITGSWSEAQRLIEAQKQRQQWQPLRVSKIVQESAMIKSFYLQHSAGRALLPFEAGQHLTIKVTPNGSNKPVIRTYTVSSAPHEAYYRLSVKREDDGYISKYLHETLKMGDLIEAKYPKGDFFIDASIKRPAVLLAGGIGITPMKAMGEHIAKEGLRTRYTRPTYIFHSSRTSEERAFYQELTSLASASAGNIQFYSFLSQPTADDKPGQDYNGSGRLSADVFKQTLPLDDYDFYLCGPSGFMQSMYDELMTLGIRDERIFAEAFGPSTIRRQIVQNKVAAKAIIEEGDDVIVKFNISGFEQRWSKGDDVLLEVAEAHGLEPEFSCRTGTCGSCAVKVKSGEVAYRTQPTASVNSGEALICCAVPAKGTKTLELVL